MNRLMNLVVKRSLLVLVSGIDTNRVVIAGNGLSKPLYPNDSEENRVVR